MCCWLLKGPDWCSSYKNSHLGGRGWDLSLPKAQKSPLGGVAALIHRDSHTQTGMDSLVHERDTKKAPSSVPAQCRCQGRDCSTRCHLLPTWTPLSLWPHQQHSQSLPCAHSHYRCRNRYLTSREKTWYMVLPLQERLHSFRLFSLHYIVLLTDNWAIKFWVSFDKSKIAAGHGDGAIHSTWDHLVLL